MAKKDKSDRAEPEDQSVVVLQDEEGKESSFKILFDSLFVGERQYVVLMPVDQEDSLEPEIVSDLMLQGYFDLLFYLVISTAP